MSEELTRMPRSDVLLTPLPCEAIELARGPQAKFVRKMSLAAVGTMR